MSINMKTLTQALAKTAAVIEKTVHTTVQEVTGPKPLQDYALLHQVGSAGPGLAWKLYSAKARAPNGSQYSTVCVWVLDKRALSEARVKAGLTKAAEEAFLDLVRADAARLVRLRHPGVVHVVQGLDEGKSAMAMVTEPLFASVANALGELENVVDVPKELKGMEMGLLEVKHGLLQLAESLNFLHNNARLVHRALSPESVLITVSGAWKLGGFGFAVQLDQGDSANMQTFHYAFLSKELGVFELEEKFRPIQLNVSSFAGEETQKMSDFRLVNKCTQEYDVEDALLPLQPSLNYTAPELIRNKASSIGWSSDIFSFACLAYHLIARKPLFDCHNNVKMYMNNLNYLSSEAFSSIPSDLVPDLQKMLSVNETFRPSALDFTGSPFFRNDTRLRALRFLDHLLERDNMQKSEFLKALSDMWKDFDSRVLRYKVLPPLCAELRNIVMQPMILPMVLTIAESQDKSDFELSTLPALVPVLSTATGETLLLLLKHADLVINKASQEDLISHVLPFFVRAYDDTDPRMQEEGLKRTVSLAKHIDVQLVTEALLPRVHALALRTTVAAVRVNALLCLGEMVHMLDKPSVLGILQTIQRCTAVDRSAPTLMCTLGVANSILKQHGLEFVAEHVLPLITPLLIVQQLNVQQFAKYMLFVKDILRKIEEKRGVTVSETGFQEVKQLPSHDVRQAAAVSTAVPSTSSTAKNKHSWDEDWVPTSKPQPQSSSASIPSISNSQKQTNLRTSVSVTPNQQNGSSCPPVDVEWPPRSGSIARPQPGDIGNQNHNQSTTTSTFDEIDPFANWPPRSTVPTSASISPANGIPPSTNISNNSWAFNTTTSVENHSQNRGTLMTGNGGDFVSSGNNQNSMRAMKQNQVISAPGSYSGKASTNIGSIFVSSKNDLTAPRLAPPPSTAVGRGRGGRGRARGTPGQPEQPPLLDLL